MATGPLGALLDLLFPPRCVACGRAAAWLCPACLAQVEWLIPPLCPHCGELMPGEVRREGDGVFVARRCPTHGEIAALVCCLASEEAGYITGEDIDINGGSHMD